MTRFTTRVLFIRGCPRSGTTLLADVLNEDPRVALMVEYPFGTLVRELLPVLAYQRHIDKKFVKPFRNLATSAPADNVFDTVANGARLTFPRRFPTMERFPAIVRSVVEASFEKSGIAIMGSKTPGRWIASEFDAVTTLFGPPKIVFVVRNPRDTVNSILNRRNLTRAGRDNWHYHNVDQAIDVYHEATAQLISCALELPNQTFVVGYEELLADPSKTLGRLGEFLELDLSDRSGLIQQRDRSKSILTEREEHVVEATFAEALGTWDQRQFTGPGAQAASMLGDCLMTPDDNVTYRFDSLDAMRGIFGAGWADATSDGVWSDGDVADLFLCLPAGRYSFMLQLAGFVPTPESPPVRCTFALRDALTGSLTLEHMRALRLDIGDVRLAHDGMQRLSFRFENLTEAQERGGDPNDARHLGICARALQVHRVSESSPP